MKMYTTKVAPNPKRVHIFLAEKGIEVECVEIDLGNSVNLNADFVAISPLARVPVLELDDGSHIAESGGICRYFEEQQPEPPLFGTDAKDKAVVEMWNRRMELLLMNTVANVGLHTLPFFATRVNQVPDFAEAQKDTLTKRWAWLNEEISDGRPFVAGDAFSVADLTGMTALKICDIVGLSVPDDLTHVNTWEGAVRARPSWNA